MCERILAQNCQKVDNFNFEFSMSHHNAHYQSYKNAPQGIVKPFLWLWSYCQDSWFLILCSLHTWPQPLHIHRHLQDHRHPNIHIHMLDVKMGFSYWGLDRSLKCKTVTSCFFWSRSWFLWLAPWRLRPELAEKVVFSEVDYSDKWLTAGGGGCGLLCDK